jgi:hypothetical protein
MKCSSTTSLLQSEDTRSILCEDTIRCMHANPEHGSDLCLWIDQYSTEQSNSNERRNQIQLMGGTYLTADSVMEWLVLSNPPRAPEMTTGLSMTLEDST